MGSGLGVGGRRGRSARGMGRAPPTACGLPMGRDWSHLSQCRTTPHPLSHTPPPTDPCAPDPLPCHLAPPAYPAHGSSGDWMGVFNSGPAHGTSILNVSRASVPAGLAAPVASTVVAPARGAEPAARLRTPSAQPWSAPAAAPTGSQVTRLDPAASLSSEQAAICEERSSCAEQSQRVPWAS